MSNVIVVLRFSSVDSDNISNSLDNWEVLEGLSEEDNVNVVEFSLLVDAAWVDNSAGDDVSLLSLVWEGGINDYTIEMARVFIRILSDTV